MNTTKILQQYILIKPNNFHTDGDQCQALRSLENAPTLFPDSHQLFVKSNVPLSNHSGDESCPKKPKVSSMVRRNARERRRVKLINSGYETLRTHIPTGGENRKLSKVDTLRAAVDYIKDLQMLLEVEDSAKSQNSPQTAIMYDNISAVSSPSSISSPEVSCSSLPSSTEASTTHMVRTVDMLPSNTEFPSSSSRLHQNNNMHNYENNTCQNFILNHDTKAHVKEEKVFIDLAEWLCKSSNTLPNGSIKIEDFDS